MCMAAALAHAQTHVLIIDGVNNHDWAAGTLCIRSILDEADGFSVEVSTVTPETFSQWNPNFARYQVVVNNFNGGHTEKGIEWPQRVERGLEAFVEGGGGLVVYHAANNAFLHWVAYNDMIGLGWRIPISVRYCYLRRGRGCDCPEGHWTQARPSGAC